MLLEKLECILSLRAFVLDFLSYIYISLQGNLILKYFYLAK